MRDQGRGDYKASAPPPPRNLEKYQYLIRTKYIKIIKYFKKSFIYPEYSKVIGKNSINGLNTSL
jgi:hypothetical protein